MPALLPTRTRRWAPALLAVPALALALSACGPGTAPATPAGPSTSSSASGGSGGGQVAGEADAERDAYDLKLAGCMRDLGVDVKDPAPGEGITETGPEYEAAAADCRDVIGDPPAYDWTPEELARLHDAYLVEAECYRDLGYDVEDPGPDEAITLPEGLTDEEFLSCQGAHQ